MLSEITTGGSHEELLATCRPFPGLWCCVDANDRSTLLSQSASPFDRFMLGAIEHNVPWFSANEVSLNIRRFLKPDSA